MVVEDLMVGNWVRYKKVAHRIKRIVSYDVVFDKPRPTDDSDYIIAKVKECEPVPLTRDVLVEIGFLESKDKYLLDSGKHVLVLEKLPDKPGYALSVGVCNTRLRVEYVHRLQQILKVYGYDEIQVDLDRMNCEYRVGNWVVWKGGFARISACGSLSGLYTLSPWDDSREPGQARTDEFGPACMSLETLRDSGYSAEESGDGKVSFSKPGADDFSLAYSRNDAVWRLENTETGKQYVGYVQYVHQFQNICSGLGFDPKLHPSAGDVPDAPES